MFFAGELAVFVFVGTFEGLGVGEFFCVEEAVSIFILGVELLGAVVEEFFSRDDLVAVQIHTSHHSDGQDGNFYQLGFLGLGVFYFVCCFNKMLRRVSKVA